MSTNPLWTPANPSETQTAQFRAFVNRRHGIDLANYEQLWGWSCAERAKFWAAVWDYENVVGERGVAVVDESKTPEDNPEWFKGSKLNWAENQLRFCKDHPDDTAIIQLSEGCPSHVPRPIHVLQSQLYSLVSRLQTSLKEAGIIKGDRIAFWGGNCIEAVVVLLAASSIGAIFSSAAADFGVQGVIERLEQIRPKILFVTNGVVYAGSPRPLLPLLTKLIESLSVPPETTVIIPHLPESLVPSCEANKQVLWETFLSEKEGEIQFMRMGFNDPIWILFSSGTTGKPKAIVHRQGGMLLDSLREHHIAGDISRGDVYFYYTTPGWMMFQYLVSGLATGATIVLYEGSPLKDPAYLWDVVDTLGVTVLGTSAKWIEQISKHYPNVKDRHDLGSLRQILSTGSPLPPKLFDFVYENVKKDVLLGSITGGTDICSVFAGRNTSLPVYRGEIQSRMLGFALATDSPDGQSPGELVCLEAFPIEPLGFWPLEGYGFDEAEVLEGKRRFKESYFKGDEGVWYHGDYVQITPSRSDNSGGLVMLGRSDGVLNPGGIRFGPTDIYSMLETDEFAQRGIEDVLVVGLMVDDGADEKVVLFVKMQDGVTLDEALLKAIKTKIRLGRSARHVPSIIQQVRDVPVTLTGKKVEGRSAVSRADKLDDRGRLVPIRKVINGAKVESINPATLRNPECLDEYVELGQRMRREEGIAI
ncbi:acetoacetyl-CoA synthetase, partial [Tremellales sp. Uapishka_1]